MKSYIKFTLLTLMALQMSGCNLTAALGNGSHGQPVIEVGDKLISTTANSMINIDHTEWDTLLKKYVNEEGFVDYKGFLKDHDKLKAYLTKLSKTPPIKDWSVQELLAYYINLYNAATVDLILDNYPIKSIKDISRPWAKGFVNIGDKVVSLNAIEHGILRKMNEPRIHFAINCASFSCPKLMRDAFTAAKINEQLGKATVEFINGNQNDISENNPKLSKIFDFYTSDFKVDGKADLTGYINQYSSIKINPKAKYSFKDYDWSLNEQH
ncbi:DUF547 domain-containing protein [Gelidibacter salicanalis]|uniref:DUF547 domain-containing protein n=1 Tax=Gelidibacter salicanalis TaxID=291193 RepID=A0A934KN79_9FLAO|nr:DUF547 domain-containing protein [Gelidibacter salicanalis]MBJ7880804.1 DUF547 domain-containing protein [Gelidibacter salicanalis]